MARIVADNEFISNDEYTVRDERGNIVYQTKNDYWLRNVYNSDGYQMRTEDSNGQWKVFTRDEDNLCTRYIDNNNSIIDMTHQIHHNKGFVTAKTIQTYKSNKGPWFNIKHHSRDINEHNPWGENINMINKIDALEYNDSNGIHFKYTYDENIKQYTNYIDSDNNFFKYIPGIQYEDSDGNYWNKSMNIPFPYTKLLTYRYSTHLCLDSDRRMVMHNTYIP